MHPSWPSTSNFSRRPRPALTSSSISFLTPFAQFAQFSSNYVGNYSAQQALLDHRGQPEFVKITVEIYLTNSYGALIPNPAATRFSSSPPLIPRPYEFWRDFRVQVSYARHILSPSDSERRPLYRSGRYGPCRPRGAAIDFEFPASPFASHSATVEAIPHQRHTVSVD